jgi:hypothetical protein
MRFYLHPKGLTFRSVYAERSLSSRGVIARGRISGGGLRKDLADHGYDADALLVPAPDPELSHSALEALLVAAGRDGPWHDGWVDPEGAGQARQTTDRLAAILLREEHSHDQELPLQP